MSPAPRNLLIYFKKDATARGLKSVVRSKPKSVRFCSLFKFSTALERLLLFVGVVCAIVAGLGPSLINVVYGEFVDVLVHRQFPTEQPSKETMFLKIFGGGKILTNDTEERRMEALNEDSLAIGLSTCAFSVASFISLAISITIFSFVSWRQVNRIGVIMFKTILSQEMTWFDVKGIPNVSTALSVNLVQVRKGIGEQLSFFIYQNSVTFFMLAFSLYIGWLLTVVLLVCIIPILIIFLILSQIQESLTSKEMIYVDQASSLAEEIFYGIRTVFAFSGENKEVERYSELVLASRSVSIRKYLATAIAIGTVWFIVFCCYAVAYFYGFRLILWYDEYTPSVLITVFYAVLTAATNISYSGPFWEVFGSARGSASSIFHIIEAKPKVDSFSDKGESGRSCEGEVEFRNVHFYYPSRPQANILRGLNLKIKAGETVAIIGGSGSGKSTILQLIQRFYDPVEGDIFLDGVNLKQLNVTWLRRQIGIVQQEPMLFSVSIRENISYGLDEATVEDVIRAAIRANAHLFIMNLSEEYETSVGERGSQLSGGQKQRIAIARALIRNPKILLLDEATSALDFESEKLVGQTLEQVAVDRTTIIVTHKLSSLTYVDRIIVLENGEVSEEGTHDELLKIDGVYKRLLQAEISNLGRVNAQHDTSSKNQSKTPLQGDQLVTTFDMKESFLSGFSVSSREKSLFRRSPDDRYIKVTFSQFLDWNRPKTWYLYVGLGASVLLGCILPSVCILYGELLELFSVLNKDGVFDKVDIYATLFVFIGIITGILTFFQQYCLGVASSCLTTKLKIKTFETIMHQEVGWFDSENNRVSILCSRLNDDCKTLNEIISGRFGVILQCSVAMILAVIISFIYSWEMALITSLFALITFVGLHIDKKSSNKEARRELEIVESATKIAVEAVKNIKMVHSLGREAYFLEKFSKALHKQRSSELLKASLLRGLAFALAQMSIFFSYAFSLWLGGYLIYYKGLHFKEILRVPELIIYGGWVLAQSIALAPNFRTAQDAASRLQYLFLRWPKVRDGSRTLPPDMRNGGRIDFSHVYFSYPNNPKDLVLRNINLSILSGKSVALVGTSGSGKSTIVQLLLRFYDPNVGTISVGDVRITNLTLSALRRSIGLVSQEPVLFDRTIYENIAYGDNEREVKMEEVTSAAKAAGIHSFIAALPMAYNTRLGSSFGTQLSGGQKQRIAIARVLVRNPQILLLDEVTSALDPESEQSLQETLDSVMAGRTTVTVAHRLGAIANVDTIYVLRNGQIVESGNHNDLMRAKGFYYSMHEQ